MWRKLIKQRHLARRFIRCHIGSGTLCSFWHDHWLSIGPLSHLVGSSAYRVTGIPYGASVSEAIVSGRWRISPRSRSPIITFLRDVLPDPTSLQQTFVQDNYRWTYPEDTPTQSTVGFSASRTFTTLYPPPPDVAWHTIVWFKGRIPKHSFITWLATLDRLATRDRIRKFSPITPAACLLCNTHDETRDHLFFSCSYSYSLFCTVMQLIPTDRTLTPLLQWLPRSSNNKHIRLISHLLLQAMIYNIWRERNSRLHTSLTRPFEHLVRDIQITVKAKLISLSPSSTQRDDPSLLESWFGMQAHDIHFRLQS